MSMIKSHVVSYYENLFIDTSFGIDSHLLDDVIPQFIIVIENCFLITVPSVVDIKDNVFSLDPSISFGLDANLFYRSCWEIIGSDVCQAVMLFFQYGYIALV